MQLVSIVHAKNQLSSLIHAVEQGEEVLLTRHGKPVVRLVATDPPVAQQVSAADLEAQVLARLAAARAKLQGRMAWSDWKDLRDEGRRF
jgi:prevent-host-death family protein